MSELEMPWGRMAYRQTAGAGLPLMLLHGTGCDSQDWAEVLRRLPVGRPVVTLDFRSHGESAAARQPFTLRDLADDALFLLARLGIERAAVMGHSLGGMAAMDAAARSGLIVGLVLIEGWTSLSAAAAFGPDHHYGRLSPEQIAQIEKKYEFTRSRTDPAAWSEFRKSVPAFSGQRFLAQTGLPICEAYGDLGRPAQGEALQMPARLYERISWIERAGHYLPHERPAEVAAICADFMRTNSFWPDSAREEQRP